MVLKSGDIKIGYKDYKENISKEKNAEFDVSGLLTVDSSYISSDIFKDKQTLVQFSFYGCGACKRHKLLFPYIFDKTPNDFQILTISIDRFDSWKDKESDNEKWLKLNIGKSDLRKKLKIRAYPTYFVINDKGKIISRPREGIGYIRNYYDFRTTTNSTLLKAYIVHLKETNRFWNHILFYVSIYFFFAGCLFLVLALINGIRSKRLSKKQISIFLFSYIIATSVFLILDYFKNGRESIERINTKNKYGLGKEFVSYDTKQYLEPNTITLVNFFRINNSLYQRDFKRIPALLKERDDLNILSISLDDSSIWEKAQKEDIYIRTRNNEDSILVNARFELKQNDKWRIVHGLKDTSWRNLQIKRIPTYLILNDSGVIIERPQKGIEFVKNIEFAKPSFTEFLLYIEKKAGKGSWLNFIMFGALLLLVGVYGIIKMTRYIIKRKVHGGNKV